MSFKKVLLASFIGVAVGATACGRSSKGGDTTTTQQGTENKSLYDRLGGKDNIAKVVDELVANVAADARINAFFANTDIPDFKAKLVDQICEASGGPCKYTGKSMKESHVGMGVKKEHFAALVEDLVKALDKLGVPEKEKQELLGALAPMEPDIVEQ